MRETLEIFIQNLKDREFSQAHENMEAQWKIYKREANPITKLLKGFINGATAFELVRRGKMDGAVMLWGTYEKYLPLMSSDIEEYELFVKADEILQEYKRRRVYEHRTNAPYTYRCMCPCYQDMLAEL